jgi:hypothetical protein
MTCAAKHHYMYVELDDQKLMYDDWNTLPYFVVTPHLVIETKLMNRLNVEVLVLCAAYR